MEICKICGFRNTSTDIFVIKEMMFGLKDKFNYFQCKQCDCIQIENFPANIDRYYASNYYSLGKYEGKRFSGFRGLIYKLRNNASFFRSNFFFNTLHLLSPIKKYEVFQGLGVTKKSKILDVGCGNGDFFIYPLRELGFEKVAGCDPFIDEDILYTNGLKIYKTDIFGMEGEWDLIIYNHSFEHLPNPFENLERVRKLLTPSGICIIRTPIVPCYAWDKYGVNWFQLDAPRHFFIHSSTSIKKMCDKVGLEIENIEYDSSLYQFIASEEYQKEVPLINQKRKKNIIDKLKRLRFAKLAKVLNANKQGDQVAFVLRNALQLKKY